MKKILALLLAFAMAFALAACGGGKAPSESTDQPDASQSEASGGKGGILTEDGECTQKQMEDTIVSYLSKAGGVSALTLCGGSSIEYTAAFIMSVDSWTIYDPDMEWEKLRDSIDAQLSPAGFVRNDMNLFGIDWTATVGGEEMTLLLFSQDEDENYYHITCMPELAEPFSFDD